MAEEEGNDNFIDIEEEDEEDENQGEGMQFDINKAMQDCKGIEKIEARNDTGKRQKFDSATYEKNKQEKEKK